MLGGVALARALLRHQAVVGAIFGVALLWMLQEILDEHLNAAQQGFGSGFLHGMQKIDHFLAMIGLGLWGARLPGGWPWLVPAFALSLVTIGAESAIGGFALPCTPTSLAPVLALAACLLVFDQPWARGFALGAFAWLVLCHGHEHGEIVAGSSWAHEFAGGFAFVAMLTGWLGVDLGKRLARRFPRLGYPLAASALALCAAGTFFLPTSPHIPSAPLP